MLEQSLEASENALESPAAAKHKTPDKDERLSPDQQQILVNLVKVKD